MQVLLDILTPTSPCIHFRRSLTRFLLPHSCTVAIARILIHNTGVSSPTLSITIDPTAGFVAQSHVSGSPVELIEPPLEPQWSYEAVTPPLILKVPTTGNELRLVFELTGDQLDAQVEVQLDTQLDAQLNAQPNAQSGEKTLPSVPPRPPRPQKSGSTPSQPQEQDTDDAQIFFTVARSERDIKELCLETGPRRLGFLTPVITTVSKAQQGNSRIHRWEWSYPTSEGTSNNSAVAGYKAVFAVSSAHRSLCFRCFFASQ